MNSMLKCCLAVFFTAAVCDPAQAQVMREYRYMGVACDKESHLKDYLSAVKDSPKKIDSGAIAAVNEKHNIPLACMEIRGSIIPLKKTVSDMKVRGVSVDIYRAAITRLSYRGWMVAILPYLTYVFAVSIIEEKKPQKDSI